MHPHHAYVLSLQITALRNPSATLPPTHSHGVMAPPPLPPLDLPDYWGDRPPPPIPRTTTARRRRPVVNTVPTDVSLADYATSELPDLQLFFRAIVTVARRSIGNAKQSTQRSPSYSSSIDSDVDDNSVNSTPNSPNYRPHALPSISVESLTSMDDDEDRERVLDCTSKPPRMPNSPSYLVHSISQLWLSITDTIHSGTRAPPPSPLPPFTTHFAPSRSSGEWERISRRVGASPLRSRPHSARLPGETVVRRSRRPPSAAPALESWRTSRETRRTDDWNE